MWNLDVLPLTGDEAYYLLWSQRLDWAYYDHPAGVALLTRLSTLVGGSSEFGVRWLNASLGVLVVALLVRVGHRFLSRQAGTFAAAMVALGAPFLIIARFVYTDTFQLALMLVNLWAFYQLLAAPTARNRPDWKRGLAFGISLALLFNTKYNAYVYAAALGLVVLLWHRWLLQQGTFWLGIGVGALGLLPVLVWNAAHDWASFRWQLAHFTSPSPGIAFSGVLRQWLSNAQHAWTYLTPPVVLAGTLGLGRVRRSGERLLTLLSLALLLPVALSVANSPRNLIVGGLFLLLLTGER
ncbi:MAG: ArnT family glycosyltransferase, partial [Anaerolineae bacterium]